MELYCFHIPDREIQERQFEFKWGVTNVVTPTKSLVAILSIMIEPCMLFSIYVASSRARRRPILDCYSSQFSAGFIIRLYSLLFVHSLIPPVHILRNLACAFFPFINLYIFPKFLNILKLDNTRRKTTMLFNLQDMFRLVTLTDDDLSNKPKHVV